MTHMTYWYLTVQTIVGGKITHVDAALRVAAPMWNKKIIKEELSKHFGFQIDSVMAIFALQLTEEQYNFYQNQPE